MKNQAIWNRLEAKRRSLGENQTAFAERLGMPRDHYYEYKKKAAITQNMIPAVIKILGVTKEEILASSSQIEVAVNSNSEQELSADDLKFMLGIVEGAGQALPLELLLKLAKCRK